jgi:hypothetical protein
MRVGVLVVSALVAGCARPLAHPVYAAQPTTALVEVDRPPPPARVEILPTRPSPEAVWIDGEWLWRRARWAWLPGRWVQPPPGATFAAWAFVRGADGRLWYAPGAWYDARRAPMVPPASLGIALVEAGAVVDADGRTETTGPILRDRPLPANALPASPDEPPKGPP